MAHTPYLTCAACGALSLLSDNNTAAPCPSANRCGIERRKPTPLVAPTQARIQQQSVLSSAFNDARSPWVVHRQGAVSSAYPKLSQADGSNRFSWREPSATSAPYLCVLRRGKSCRTFPRTPFSACGILPSLRSGRVSLDEAEPFLHNRDVSVVTLRWCSGSSRNAVRNHLGFSVRLRRNTQGRALLHYSETDAQPPAGRVN